MPRVVRLRMAFMLHEIEIYYPLYVIKDGVYRNLSSKKIINFADKGKLFFIEH